MARIAIGSRAASNQRSTHNKLRGSGAGPGPDMLPGKAFQVERACTHPDSKRTGAFTFLTRLHGISHVRTGASRAADHLPQRIGLS
jgi:hypothetical protein